MKLYLSDLFLTLILPIDPGGDIGLN